MRYKKSLVSDYDASFQDSARELGERAKQLRLIRNLRQDELAERAGVGVATVRRFEQTGMAAMDSVLRIALALNAEAGIARLFEAPAYRSIDEALARPEVTRRRRASRRTQ
jgi:transcriptional regulator with XRE-family HTH domain